MTTTTHIMPCENCGKKFKVIEKEMSWPVGTEVETWQCPYCDHGYSQQIQGTINSEPLPENER